jgi:hypothetical protein
VPLVKPIQSSHRESHRGGKSREGEKRKRRGEKKKRTRKKNELALTSQHASDKIFGVVFGVRDTHT